MPIDVDADYLRTISPQSPSKSDLSIADKRHLKIDKGRQWVYRGVWSTRGHAKYRWKQHLYKDKDDL